MKQEILSYLYTIKDDIYTITRYLYDNPEESYNEKKACSFLMEILRRNNFKVTGNFLDIPTAFCSEYGSGYPKLCFLCEYDALLPEGHINGHNLGAAISTAAALSLSKIIGKVSGTIVLLGCPGEYIGGAKVTMAKQGVFNDIDIAMMVHPDVKTYESGTSKAILPLSIKFTGVDGVTYLRSNCFSPVDAGLFVFNGINMILKGCGDKVQIDVMVNSGGLTPSLPSDVSEMKIYIRADTLVKSESIKEKIIKLAETASFITNFPFESKVYELPDTEMLTNSTLSRIFSHNLKELGIIDCCGPKEDEAGLSMGSVSQVIPSIHPYIRITENADVDYGTPEFAAETLTPFAQDTALKAAGALAASAFDLIEKESILTEIKEEFYSQKRK
ncbi:MAG: M20 family peptidase [Bacillota bacterium]|nr:M20 family peptidase [Bacillota bacterium]